MKTKRPPKVEKLAAPLDPVVHTPLPWIVQEGRFSIAMNGTEFSIVMRTDKGLIDTTIANWIKNKADANLIAAAPKLLAALKKVVAISDRKHDAWDEAKAAIAEATGVGG